MAAITFSTSSSYDYDQLEQKYKGFAAPSFEILVGGVKLADQTCQLQSIEINIPVGAGDGARRGEASSCTFQLSGQFDLGQKRVHRGFARQAGGWEKGRGQRRI